jgi:NAD(P)-dependent dehydrogenase (short-subunit alcohol dehydrogenase family)
MPARTTAALRPALGPPLAGPAIDLAASHPRPHAATEMGAVATLRFTWFPVEVAAPPETPSPDLACKRIIVVNGRSAAAERVALALARAGARAWIFAPAPGEDVAAAARTLISENGPIDGIVDLGLQTPFSLQSVGGWETPIRRTLALLHACYDDWLSEESTSRLFFLAVTWMDGQMGYGGRSPTSPASEQPLGGIWAGLAKTLPQELPNCNVRVMDLAPDEADAVERRVVAELYRWGLFEIGWFGGRRYTLQAERDDLRPCLAPPVGPNDVVLFSGGGRGIGLLCARAIAERFGATVIVTGREQPAQGSEPWAQLDEAGFKLYARRQIALATRDRPPAVIRREMDRLQRRRELRHQLEDLARRGLPVHYRVCDVTDAAAVRAVCEEIGNSLRVIVHNAGIDRPVRLAQKTAESFIDTVRTKVVGFAHLCAAAADHPGLLQFCSVGSLTGRWGGMTGETDYAAANDALARLGFWSARHALSCAVKTLAWPTWEGVGMITNFDVTKRYVSPMRVAEGVRHWLAELGDSRSGEVMFMGAVGRAVTPIQIKGFSPVYGLPNISGLIFRHHHAGEPLRFRPFSRFATCYRIPRRHAPFLRAFFLDGRPSLPSALLMEHACGVGGWVSPEGFRPMHLTGLANIRVQLNACVLPPAEADSPVKILSEAVGYWVGTDWVVDVCSKLATSGGEVLRLTLVHREAAPSAMNRDQNILLGIAGRLEVTPLPPVLRPSWNRRLLGRTEWQMLCDGATSVRTAWAAPADAADLWAVPYPPPLLLPINHLETILHAVWAACGDGREAALSTWLIESIEFGGISSASAERVTELGSGHFAITDRNGRVVMEVKGATVLSQDDIAVETDQPSAPVVVASNRSASSCRQFGD